MTTDEQKLHIVSNLKLAKQFKTNLVLGQLGCKLFKQVYKGDIHTLKSAEDVREFKNMYFFKDETPLVFEDLSLMTPEVQSSLLKFIEEPERPLIVLCSDDNVSDAMMSRFMNYVKLEEPLPQQFLSVLEFISLRETAIDKQRNTPQSEHPDYTPNEKLIITDLNKACLKLCPEYWYWSTFVKLNKPEINNPDTYLKLMFM